MSSVTSISRAPVVRASVHMAGAVGRGSDKQGRLTYVCSQLYRLISDTARSLDWRGVNFKYRHGTICLDSYAGTITRLRNLQLEDRKKAMFPHN